MVAILKHYVIGLFWAYLSIFLVLAVPAISAATQITTTVLTVGSFDVGVSKLPANGSFIYRPSSSLATINGTAAISNFPILNVIVGNKTLIGCKLNLSSFFDEHLEPIWVPIYWTMTSTELLCTSGRKANEIHRYRFPTKLNDDSDVNLRLGRDQSFGCLKNFTLYNDEVVSFSCPTKNFSLNDKSASFFVSTDQNALFTIQRTSNTKCCDDCFECQSFPTPKPFFLNSRNVQTAVAKNEPKTENTTKIEVKHFVNASTDEVDSIESNGTEFFNFTNLNITTLVFGGDHSRRHPTSSTPTACSSQPCLNNGTCRDLNATEQSAIDDFIYQCKCPQEYFGINCQNFNSCVDASNCKNGGRCSVGNETTICLCQSNFTGLFCEVESNRLKNADATSTPTMLYLNTSTLATTFNPCFSAPCLNNGTCVRTSDANFTCICLPIWDGDKICSTKRNDVAAFNCSSACKNGGVCNSEKNECVCTNTGFTGRFCQEDIDECLSFKRNPCQNGAVCNNTVGSYECVCLVGFVGKDCSESVAVKNPSGPSDDTDESSSKVGAIVGGIFGALAFIALIVGGVFLFRYVNRSRKLKGKYNPAKEEMHNISGNPMPLSTLPTGERLI